MIAIVILAVGVAVGVDYRRIGILALVIFVPLLAVAALVPVFIAATRRTDARPALFCEGVASELRSGSSVLDAIAASGQAVGAGDVVAAARAGDLKTAAARAGTAFPSLARELEITISRSGRTGGAAADLFDEIAALALAQEEIRREVRVAAAPARAATALFVILPGGFIVSRWASGDLSGLVATGGQRVMVTVGLAVFVIGLVISGWLVWRAR